MKKVLAYLTCMFFFIAVPSSLLFGNQDEQYPKNKVFIVKGDHYYPPYEFINEQGEPDGFNIELFKKIADDLGLKYVLQLDQWAKVRDEIENGKIDVVTGAIVSNDRAKKVVFGLPHSMMTNGLFVQRGSNIQSLNDLTNKTIAVQEADYMHDYIYQLNITPFLRLTNSQLEALQLVNDGKCDAAVVGNFQGSGIIKKYQLKNVVLRSSDFPSQPYAMAVSKGNEELLMILDKGLLNLKESGVYDELYKKWFGIYERQSFIRNHQSIFLIVIVFIVSLLFFTILLNARIKSIKHKLIEQEQKYRRLITNAKDLVVAVDTSGQFTFVSPSYCELFGKQEHELIGMQFMPLVHHDDREATNLAMEQLQRPPYHATLEQRAFTKDGWRWIQWSDTAVLNEENEVVEIIGVGQDITEKKSTELEKTISEKRFKTLLDNAHNIAVQGIQTDGTIKYWNKACERFYGYTEAEALGKKIFDLIIPEKDKAYVQQSIQKMIESRKAIKAEELTLIHKNGKNVNVYCNHVVVETFDNACELFSLDVNLDDLRKAEAAQNVLFNIANALSIHNKLEDLVEIIRVELNKLMDCSNLYIAFYDDKTGMLSSLNEKDEHENIPQWPAKGSLTGIVIEEKRSLLINQSTFNKWAETGKVQLVGKASEIWLGVPLFEGEKVIGAIVTQSFDNPLAYDESSVAIMEFASKQISQVLQKQSAMDELVIAKQKAEESDQLKTSFLNNLSHEIRTPLNIIVGYAQILESNDIKQSEKQNAVFNIRKEGKELTNIIDNIIITSSIQTGQEKLIIETRKMDVFLNNIAAEYEDRLLETDIHFEKKIVNNTKHSFIQTDYIKIKKIIDQLLENAIKFTGKGKVQLFFELTPRKLKIVVSDNGPGIDPALQQEIFRSFYKLEKNNERLYRGNGLGLGIVKAYISMLNGTIQLDSSPGKGSTFSCTIPLEKAEIQNEDRLIIEDDSGNNSLNILVVEDEESNMLFIRSLLRSTDYQITSAKNAFEAIEAIQRNQKINLVLMDIKLPGMDGYEASKQIKKIRPSIKIIAVTAYALHGDKQKALESEIDDYLSKPFQKDDLLAILQDAANTL